KAEASKNELLTSSLFIFIPLKDFFHLALDAEKIGQYCKVADFARRLYAAILDSLTFAVDPHYWNIESAGRHHVMIIALSGVQPLLAFCSCSRFEKMGVSRLIRSYLLCRYDEVEFYREMLPGGCQQLVV